MLKRPDPPPLPPLARSCAGSKPTPSSVTTRRTVPSCRLTSTRADFTLAWDDWESETPAQSYSIYASEDGGPFSEFRSNTAELSAVFTGQRGHAYSFYSRASDTYAQVEDAPAIPDASTTIRARLEVSRDQSNLVIRWDGPGQLQSAHEINGLWENVLNATSPHPFSLTNTQSFFRVSQ